MSVRSNSLQLISLHSKIRNLFIIKAEIDRSDCQGSDCQIYLEQGFGTSPAPARPAQKLKIASCVRKYTGCPQKVSHL